MMEKGSIYDLRLDCQFLDPISKGISPGLSIKGFQIKMARILIDQKNDQMKLLKKPGSGHFRCDFYKMGPGMEDLSQEIKHKM